MKIIEVKDRIVVNDIHRLRYMDVPDGKYLILLKRINEERTIRDYQEQYFYMIDEVVKLTGNSKYAIHDSFKTNQDIETTKGFSIEEWIKFIEDFKWYCFENMEVLI